MKRPGLAAIAQKKKPKSNAGGAIGFGGFIRAEYPLIVGLGTAAIFLGAGSRLVDNLGGPLSLAVIFLWLFVVVLWSALSVVRHADCLAVKCGEPYGTK
jgi:Ca2+:H+ antiporter